MPKLIQTGAVQADVDVCNAVDLPKIGCHAGGGIHVVIPADWQTRILSGQQVAGCTYYALQPDTGGTLDALSVSDFAVAQLAIPAVVNALPAPQKAQAPLLNTKLATAISMAAVQVP